MMKIVWNILSLIVLSYSIYAQEDEKFYKRSVGVDASFINNFIPLGNNIGSRGTYLFHFIRYTDEHRFVKRAYDIRVQYRDVNRQPDINNLFLSFDMKIGRGRKKEIIPKLNLLYGADISFGMGLSNRHVLDTLINIDNSTWQQVYTISTGPFVGIEYRFLKRLGIYTEALFHVRYIHTIEKIQLKEDETSTVSEFASNFILPRSIVLFYNF